MQVLEHHRLGCIDEGSEPGQYEVFLFERKPAGDPWYEILEFCEETGCTTDELIYDLNFALYDG